MAALGQWSTEGRNVEVTAEPSYEEAYRGLSDVVEQLEKGELTLEQSLALFERGMALARLCESKLDEAEQKVRQLIGVREGSPEYAPFEPEE